MSWFWNAVKLGLKKDRPKIFICWGFKVQGIGQEIDRFGNSRSQTMNTPSDTNSDIPHITFVSDKPSQTLSPQLLFSWLLAQYMCPFSCLGRLPNSSVTAYYIWIQTCACIQKVQKISTLTVLKKNFKLSVRMLKVLWYQNLVGRERSLSRNSLIHNLYKKLNRTCLFIWLFLVWATPKESK